MAREILFKAKIKNWREQPKDQWWVEGYYCKRKTGRYTDIGFEEEYKDCIVKEFSDGEMIFHDVDPETVCQYTGLTDSTKWEQLSENEKLKFLSEWNYREERKNEKEDWNGRKIFEGDIVAFTDTYATDSGYAEGDCVGKVVWDEEEVCFHVTERLYAESWEVLQECCVVGNIFDNPELLKED